MNLKDRIKGRVEAFDAAAQPWAAWNYPAQADGWDVVPLSKLGSWYLLMLLSFALVTLVHRPERVAAREPVRRAAQTAAAA